MPLGTRHQLIGRLVEHDAATLMLLVDNGGRWRLGGGRQLRSLIGRRVAVSGTRAGFDLLDVDTCRDADEAAGMDAAGGAASTIVRDVGQRLAFALLIALSLLAIAQPAASQTATGRVVRVADGDTITVLVDGRQQLRVRLAYIDAPESGQPYGRAARQMLAAIVAGRTVTIRQTDTDRYGRTVALVKADDVDVNTAMVRQGGAWAYRKYLPDGRLLQVEREARAAKRGLWALQQDQIMPPWQWRHQQHGRSGR